METIGEKYLGWGVTENWSMFWKGHSGCWVYKINCPYLMSVIGSVTLSN